jgi:four helix bundle protein
VELTVECYEITKRFPRQETFGLCDQLRRAAVSVPANIAEGNGRRSRRDGIRFLLIAHASLMELDTHLHLASRLGYVTDAEISRAMQLRTDVGRMLGGLVTSLRSAPSCAPRGHRPS